MSTTQQNHIARYLLVPFALLALLILASLLIVPVVQA